MRAYKENGKFVEGTAADAAQLSNAARTRRLTAPTTNAAAAGSDSTPQMVYGPYNSIQILLDEESMVFQTAHKDAGGKLTQQCVTGEDSAMHALHSAPATKESSNDR
jgi:hypothetical protein